VVVRCRLGCLEFLVVLIKLTIDMHAREHEGVQSCHCRKYQRSS
jgi:hypothetical protein